MMRIAVLDVTAKMETTKKAIYFIVMPIRSVHIDFKSALYEK